MQCLRLYFAAGEAEAGWPWALRDAQGRVLVSGGAQDPWPPADEIEVILAAGATRFARIILPVNSDKIDSATLGYALEPELLNAPEDNLYVVADVEADGAVWVALTALAPLRQLQAALADRGLAFDRLVPEEVLLPLAPPGRWSLAELTTGWLVRASAGRALFLPQSAAALAATLGEPPAGGLCVSGAVRLPPLWAHLACRVLPPHDWRSAELAGRADFACGPLAPLRIGRQWRHLQRRMTTLLLVLVVAETGFCLLETGWLSWRQQRLRQSIASEAQQMELPERQAERTLAQAFERLERLRLQHGVPLRTGVLPMLSLLAQAAGDGWRVAWLDYRQQRLEWQAAPLNAGQQARLRASLRQRYLGLNSGADGQWLIQRESR